MNVHSFRPRIHVALTTSCKVNKLNEYYTADLVLQAEVSRSKMLGGKEVGTLPSLNNALCIRTVIELVLSEQPNFHRVGRFMTLLFYDRISSELRITVCGCRGLLAELHPMTVGYLRF